MNNLVGNIDIIIVISFLVINLIVGLYSGKSIKTIKEYAIGNRNFSTATIAATIVATWLSGASFTVTTTETYNNGLYFIIPGLGDAMSFFIISYLYAPRMAEFLGKLSVADAMGSIYGKHIRSITAVSGIFPAVGNVAMQFSILAALLNSWLGIPGIYAIAASSLIIITYSTFGGIKSVTFTDMIQFFAFGVVMPIIAFVIWSALPEAETVFNSINQHPSFNYHAVFDYHDPNFLNILFLFLFFMIPGIDSAVFQRISMARNTIQVSKSFIIAGFFVIICDLIVNTFIGVMLVADNAPPLDSGNVVPYIVNHYLTNGFKGLFIIGIMAMIMSTADSYINSSAVLFAYDISETMNLKLTERKHLLFVRIAAFLIGIFALLLSLFLNNLLELVLATYSFYMPIVSVPLILAIFGFRSSSRAVLIGMTAGFITVMYFKFFSEIDSIVPGMVANAIFFIGSHYILREQGGWRGVKATPSLDSLRAERARKRYQFIQSLKNFNLITFCQNNTPREKRIFVYFGLFCVLTISSSVYSLPKAVQNEYSLILNPIYYLALILSTMFITYPLWSEKFANKAFTSLLWNIAVFYNLAFCNSVLAIAGQFNQLHAIILMASLTAIAILIRWQTAILFTIIGVAIAVQYCEMYMNISSLNDHTDNLQLQITYSLLLISVLLLSFFKQKQEENKITELKVSKLDNKLDDQKLELIKSQELKDEFLRNLQHEIRTPVTGITSIGQVLWDNYDKFTEQQRRSAIKEIAESSERLVSLVNNMVDLSKLKSLTYELSCTKVNLSELIYQRSEICRKIYLNDKELEFIYDIQDNLMVNCDKHYITSTLDNLITNAISYSPEGTITVSFRKEENLVKFNITDEGLGIPPQELHHIFGTFMVSSRTKTPSGGRGLGLALCKKVIEAHKGQIWCESDGKNGSSFTFVIPYTP